MPSTLRWPSVTTMICDGRRCLGFNAVSDEVVLGPAELILIQQAQLERAVEIRLLGRAERDVSEIGWTKGSAKVKSHTRPRTCPFWHVGSSVRIVAKKSAYGVVIGMSPSNAEGMTGWVRVDPVAFARGEVAIFEQPCAQTDGTGVRRARVAHVEVEVHLLRVSVGPIRWDMVGCKLYTNAPIPVSVEHGVEPFIGEHMPAKHCGPKGALRRKIGCIEHNDLTHDVHPPFCQRWMPHLPWTALTVAAGEPWGSTSLGAVGVECADRNTQPVRGQSRRT